MWIVCTVGWNHTARPDSNPAAVPAVLATGGRSYRRQSGAAAPLHPAPRSTLARAFDRPTWGWGRNESAVSPLRNWDDNITVGRGNTHIHTHSHTLACFLFFVFFSSSEWTAMPPQRVFALPRQQSLLLPAVINPFVQDTKLSKSAIIKVSMALGQQRSR